MFDSSPVNAACAQCDCGDLLFKQKISRCSLTQRGPGGKFLQIPFKSTFIQSLLLYLSPQMWDGLDCSICSHYLLILCLRLLFWNGIIILQNDWKKTADSSTLCAPGAYSYLQWVQWSCSFTLFLPISVNVQVLSREAGIMTFTG